MFTVKWIQSDCEQLFEAHNTWMRHTDPRSFNFVDKNGDHQSFTEGDFFVMNEHGQTVGDYHLHPKGVSGQIPPPPKPDPDLIITRP